jgi:hypothetical protein
MQFLSKNPDSDILKESLKYKSSSGRSNQKLKQALLKEQQGFCAYSEKYLSPLDSVDVEHFNPALKEQDDYFNYYAVLHSCNQHKQHLYPKFAESEFFKTLFFQDPEQLHSRIQYFKDEVGGMFDSVDPEDRDAQNLIEYLGWNRPELLSERKKHLERIQTFMQDAGYDSAESQLAFFRQFRDLLSFITMLEKELSLPLMALLHQIPPEQTES